jgi:CheY-like chemotaxis protein
MSTVNNILYIDDDADDHEIFCEVVSSINPSITCHTAFSAEEALAALSDMVILPDYVFLDLNMPTMSGKQFLEHVRKDERLGQLQVVIYSTSDSHKDKVDCERLGAITFITKPNEMQGVYKQLSRLIPPTS